MGGRLFKKRNDNIPARNKLLDNHPRRIANQQPCHLLQKLLRRFHNRVLVDTFGTAFIIGFDDHRIR